MARRNNKVSDLMINDDWQKKMDAQTLAEAAKIKKDPKRMKAASEGARMMLEEEQPKIQALRGIARSSSKKSIKRK